MNQEKKISGKIGLMAQENWLGILRTVVFRIDVSEAVMRGEKEELTWSCFYP